MRKLGVRTTVEHAEQHIGFSFLPWHLAIILVCCWGWLFYLLHRALR